LHTLKNDPELASIPVVMVTITEQRELGFSLGAADYLVKPVSRPRLLQAVGHACRQAGGTILVVDDEAPARGMLQDLLTAQGYTVRCAAGGEEAVCLALAQPPDLIILDLMMPGVTGFQVVQRLREAPQGQDIPIIVFTAHDLSPRERADLQRHTRAVIKQPGNTPVAGESSGCWPRRTGRSSARLKVPQDQGSVTTPSLVPCAPGAAAPGKALPGWPTGRWPTGGSPRAGADD